MIDEQYGNCPPLLSLKYPPRSGRVGWTGLARPAGPAGQGRAEAQLLSGRRVTNVRHVIYDRSRQYFSQSVCLSLRLPN